MMTIYVFEVRFYMSCLKHTRSERTNVKCKNDEAVFLSIVCESFFSCSVFLQKDQLHQSLRCITQ